MPEHNYGYVFMGVDYSTVPHQLPSFTLADAKNVMPDAAGLPVGRGGSAKYNGTNLTGGASAGTLTLTGVSGTFQDNEIIYESALGSELGSNIGFESAGGGDPDFFANWIESAGSGSIADEGTIVNSGSHAAKLTAGNLYDTSVRTSDINTTAGDHIKLGFYCRTDGGGGSPRCRIYDVIGAAWITNWIVSGITGTTYTLFETYFTIPAGCTSFRVYLYDNGVLNSIGYFDDATIKQATNAAFANGVVSGGKLSFDGATGGFTAANTITGATSGATATVSQVDIRITSFHEFRSGSTREQLCSYSTKVVYYSSATGDFVDSITGLTQDKMFQWVNFAGKAIGVNEGSDNPQYWADSSTKGDLAGSPPKGLTVAEWSNRLWFGGDSTNVALLTGSNLNDPTTYGTGGGATERVSQTIGDSKDPITGLFGFFDMLLVGKLNNIYKVTGVPATDVTTLRIEPLYSKGTDNVGFTSQWAITQVGNDVIFLDGYDIKRLSGIQEYGDVEHASIIPHLRDFLETTADKDYLKYTQFFHYKKAQQIWVSIPTGETTHYVFVLDYRFKHETGRYAFFPMGDLPINVFGGVEDGEVVNIYYGDESGYVHQLDIGNDDNASAIERYFVTMVSGNDPANGVRSRHTYRKQFLNTETYVESEQSVLAMTPYYAVDLMNDSQVRTSGNYTALTAETVTGWDGTGVKHKRVPFFGLSANTLALKWRHNTINQNFTFYPSTVTYKWKKKNIIT